MFKTIRQLYSGLTRNSDGSFSSTKFWQTVVYIICSWIMIRLTLDKSMSMDYFLIYLAIATGARSFQTFLTNKSSNTKVAAVAAGSDPEDVKNVSNPTT